MERTREKEEKKREREKERERGKKSDKQGENGEGGGGRGRQQFAAAEKVMEFRELVVCGWRQWRRERRGRKEGRKPGRGKRRGTPVAEKSHAVWKRSILFFGWSPLSSLRGRSPLFEPTTKARDYKSSDRLSSGASASMRSSSNLLSWTRNSSGQTDSFQTNFDYWYIKDYFVSLFVSFDSESKVFSNFSGLASKIYIHFVAGFHHFRSVW